MIRGLLRSLTLAIFRRLPCDFQLALALRFTAENEGWTLKRERSSTMPWPANVRPMPRRRIANAECLFNVPEIRR